MKAVFHTCRAMHASLSGKADGQQSSFCHCERASGHLWSSLNVSGATCDPDLNHVSGAYSPGGRCSSLPGDSTLTHHEPTRPVGLRERQASQQPLPQSPARWSGGFPFRTWNQHVPTLAPGPAGPQLGQPQVDLGWPGRICSAPLARTPWSGWLRCIVVALHVLAVPVQCFHSASQRPARPSRDSPVPC